MMTEPNNEKFFAWLDGELGPAEATEMEGRGRSEARKARGATSHDG
jgi:hypothetical protein